MQRIMILGQPGSGKSTLARALGERTGLPVEHIDRIHWQSGWIERSRAEKTRLCAEVEARPEWIFEGGHSETWANRLSRADLAIWIDLPLTLRFSRILRRTLTSLGKNRPDLPPGCPERLNRGTLEFWAYVWRSRASGRANIACCLAAAPDKAVRLTSPGAVRDFLGNWPQSAALPRA